MANFFFETITAEQALGFKAGDQLIFTTAGATAAVVTGRAAGMITTAPDRDIEGKEKERKLSALFSCL